MIPGIIRAGSGARPPRPRSVVDSYHGMLGKLYLVCLSLLSCEMGVRQDSGTLFKRQGNNPLPNVTIWNVLEFLCRAGVPMGQPLKTGHVGSDWIGNVLGLSRTDPFRLISQSTQTSWPEAAGGPGEEPQLEVATGISVLPLTPPTT